MDAYEYARRVLYHYDMLDIPLAGRIVYLTDDQAKDLYGWWKLMPDSAETEEFNSNPWKYLKGLTLYGMEVRRYGT